jgi:predicted DCC family thiol-disulfide oxidoreductase YuxK
MSTVARPLPPGIGPHDRVVLFDAVCNLCNGWVQFLIAHDPGARLRLASVQSPAGQAVLAWCGLPLDQFDTMVFVEEGRAYVKSTAFLRIVRHFSRLWPLLSLGILFPRFVRDWLYDCLAQNRYAWFGRSETCLMPSAEVRGRFLQEAG